MKIIGRSSLSLPLWCFYFEALFVLFYWPRENAAIVLPTVSPCGEAHKHAYGVIVFDLVRRTDGRGEEGDLEAALTVAHTMMMEDHHKATNVATSANSGEGAESQAPILPMPVTLATFAGNLWSRASRADGPFARHARRELTCFMELQRRESLPGGASRAAANYPEPQRSRADMSRFLVEALLDGLLRSPYATTLVLVAAPTRLVVCDPLRLRRRLIDLALGGGASSSEEGVTGDGRGGAMLREAEVDAPPHDYCDAATLSCANMLATVNGGGAGQQQQSSSSYPGAYAMPLTAFVVRGRELLATWRAIFDEYSALGAVSPQHALREALLRLRGRVATANLDTPPEHSGDSNEHSKGRTQQVGGRARGGASSQCFACGGQQGRGGAALSCGGSGGGSGGGSEGETAENECHAVLCGILRCTVALNCSDASRDAHWKRSFEGSHTVHHHHQYDAEGRVSASTSQYLSQRVVAWAILQGETCAMRAAVVPYFKANFTSSPVLECRVRNVLAVPQMPPFAEEPSLLELSASLRPDKLHWNRPARPNKQKDLRRGEGSLREMDATTHRRHFLVLTTAPPDEDAMLGTAPPNIAVARAAKEKQQQDQASRIGRALRGGDPTRRHIGGAREPWLEFALAKQAYARRHGYASEMLLTGRALLAGGAGADASALLDFNGRYDDGFTFEKAHPSSGPTRTLNRTKKETTHRIATSVSARALTRCEYFRPLSVLDALLRYGQAGSDTQLGEHANGRERRGNGYRGIDWALVTDHATLIAPKHFNLSLDVFVEAAETSGRDLVFPAGTSLGHSAGTRGGANGHGALFGNFFVRNSPAGRAALVEWWAIAASGLAGCAPFDASALELLLLRRIARHTDTLRRRGQALERTARAGLLEDDALVKTVRGNSSPGNGNESNRYEGGSDDLEESDWGQAEGSSAGVSEPMETVAFSTPSATSTSLASFGASPRGQRYRHQSRSSIQSPEIAMSLIHLGSTAATGPRGTRDALGLTFSADSASSSSSSSSTADSLLSTHNPSMAVAPGSVSINQQPFQLPESPLAISPFGFSCQLPTCGGSPVGAHAAMSTCEGAFKRAFAKSGRAFIDDSLHSPSTVSTAEISRGAERTTKKRAFTVNDKKEKARRRHGRSVLMGEGHGGLPFLRILNRPNLVPGSAAAKQFQSGDAKKKRLSSAASRLEYDKALLPPRFLGTPFASAASAVSFASFVSQSSESSPSKRLAKALRSRAGPDPTSSTFLVQLPFAAGEIAAALFDGWFQPSHFDALIGLSAPATRRRAEALWKALARNRDARRAPHLKESEGVAPGKGSSKASFASDDDDDDDDDDDHNLQGAFNGKMSAVGKHPNPQKPRVRKKKFGDRLSERMTSSDSNGGGVDVTSSNQKRAKSQKEKKKKKKKKRQKRKFIVEGRRKLQAIPGFESEHESHVDGGSHTSTNQIDDASLARLVRLLSHLHISPISGEWPIPRCCHPRKASTRDVCYARGGRPFQAEPRES